MKKYLNILFVLVATGVSAQVAIGKTAVTNSSVSLEFGSGFKGLILPYITSVADLKNPVEGTIAFDVASGKIRYFKNQAANLWTDLTFNVQNVKYGNTLIADTTGKADVSIQQGLIENDKARTVIGKNTADTAPGILVMSDTNKALILPKMDSPHLNIVNPAPGMMAYDTKTNQLAVFNGTVWTFWRP